MENFIKEILQKINYLESENNLLKSRVEKLEKIVFNKTEQKEEENLNFEKTLSNFFQKKWYEKK